MESKREYPALQRVKRALDVLLSLVDDPWAYGHIAADAKKIIIDNVTSLELALDDVLRARAAHVDLAEEYSRRATVAEARVSELEEELRTRRSSHSNYGPDDRGI